MNHVPYRLQQIIYPLIKSTDGCVYCIFLRGVVMGVVLGAGGMLAWVKFFS